MHAKPGEIIENHPRPADERVARALTIILRLAGSVLMLAFGAVLLPAGWMSSMHEWLTMGAFPSSPLVDYLTRSISALYGIKGGLYWLLSTDVRRYRKIICYVGLTTMLFGVTMVFVDVRADMPLFWTLGEGPPIAAIGGIFLALGRRLSDPDPGRPRGVTV